MREHHYFDWLEFESDILVSDHTNAPDLADADLDVVIVPREDELSGQHELILLDDGYWHEESAEKVVAFNPRGYEVAVAHRS